MSDEFCNGYIEAALWSSTDDDGESLEDMDIAPETLEEMEKDCDDFVESFGHLFEGYDDAQAGHDFWLTRNGHGAGFWDGDYDEPEATELTDAAKAYGEYTLYVGDDGDVYGM